MHAQFSNNLVSQKYWIKCNKVENICIIIVSIYLITSSIYYLGFQIVPSICPTKVL